MKTETLLIVLLFAVQCIERSFGTVIIFNCFDDVTCLETVYFQKLYVGLVPILVIDRYEENDSRVSGIINFFENKPQVFKMLKVFVGFIKNTALAVYLDPGARRLIDVKYPYVAMIRNHWVLSGRSYGFDEAGLEDMLKISKNYDTQYYYNFSVGLFYASVNRTMKFQPINHDVLDWIAGMETGGYESPGSSTQHRNVSRSTPPPGASSTTAAAEVPGEERRGREAVVNTSSGSSTSSGSGRSTRPAASSKSSAARVPRRKSGGRETVVNTSSGLSMLPVSPSPSTKPVASRTSVAAHSVSRNTSTFEVNPPSPAPVTSKRQPSTVAGEIFETDNVKKQRV